MSRRRQRRWAAAAPIAAAGGLARGREQLVFAATRGDGTDVGLVRCVSRLLAGVLLALGIAGCGPAVVDGNWASFRGNEAHSQYSPLEHIDRDNVGRLAVVWTYDTGELQSGTSTMPTSPLVVDGVLYGLSPTLSAFALNAATGAELWRRPAPAEAAGQSQRGLLWWPGNGQLRLLYAAGSTLIALDPKTGVGIAGFGVDGALDLRPYAKGVALAVSLPGVVLDDVVILGLTPADLASGSASIVALNVRDGSLAWQFWPMGAGTGGASPAGALTSQVAGGALAAAMTLDAGRGLVFAVTGPPEPRFYGGKRAGDNVYADSLLALDARTGSLRWHYQVSRHDLWGGALRAPPTLVHVQRDGQLVDAVALPTRSGQLFLFERETGKALYATRTVDAPASSMTGEQAAPRQVLSDVAFMPQAFAPSTRNPEAAAAVAAAVSGLDARPWAPPSAAGTLLFPGTLAGAGPGGSAFDPVGGRLIFNATHTASILRVVEVPAGFSDRDEYLKNCVRCHGVDRRGLYENRDERYGAGGPSLVDVASRMKAQDVRNALLFGRGSMPKFDHLSDFEREAIVRYVMTTPPEPAPDVRTTETTYMAMEPATLRDHEKLPGNTPPWGTLAAIDLATGKPDWQVPIGDYLRFPGLGHGAENVGGPVLTASGLIFIAATPDMKMRAVDARDGKVLWESDLSAGGYATPVVYAVDGRQFVVIAAGGGALGPPSGSEYVAFSLPQ